MLINRSINEGIFPSSMKIAKIIPLHKDGAIDNPDNFRPISLLPVMSKLIEKHVYQAVTKFMDVNGILYMKQFGFRRHHSTINAIQLLVSEVLNAFKENLFLASVFIDLKKAFDSVSHDLILAKLECLGVRGVILNWFKSYLAERKQFTSIGNMQSDTNVMECGVPQGSLLGGLLFQLQINDMSTSLRFCNCILYADDTTVYVIGRNLRFVRMKL